MLPAKLPEFLQPKGVGLLNLAASFAKALNGMARRLNKTGAEPPLQWERDGEANKVSIDKDAGTVMVPVQLTDPLDTDEVGYYTGDVFGDGTNATATLFNQLVLLTDFDVVVDGVVPQRFYSSVRVVRSISGTPTIVYEVQPQEPLPPDDSGVWVPVRVAGIWRHTAPRDCANNTVSDIA